MADHGDLEFVSVAVQVIPVMAVLLLADEFMAKDKDDVVHRHYAASAAALGLVWAVLGEWFGFNALLRGPNEQTVPVVSGALMALAATVVVPRLAELLVRPYSQEARRVIQATVPGLCGTGGFFAMAVNHPSPGTVTPVVFGAFTTVTSFFTALTQVKKPKAKT